MFRKLLATILLSGASFVCHAQSLEIAAGGGVNNLGTESAPPHGAFIASALVSAAVPHLWLGFEYTGQRFDTVIVYPGPATQFNASEHLDNYGGVVRYDFQVHRRVEPYLLASGGATILTASYSTAGANTSLSVDGHYVAAAAGMVIPFSRHVGVRPEFRYQHQQLDPLVVGTQALNARHADEVLVTASLYYRFGK